MRDRVCLGTVCMAILFSGQPASAYNHSHCLGENLRWSGNSKTLRASPVSFPSGPYRNALQEAVDRLNLNPSKFSYGLTTDSGGVALDNGSSEVWGSTNASVLAGAPAIAYTYWTCYWFFGDVVHLDEVDIAFDYGSPWRWTTTTNKASLLRYGGTLRPLQTTALHEMGHGLKLNHVNSEYNVMGTDFEHIHVNGSTARAYLGEDASDGIVHLYGVRSPKREDLGVVHWKYASAAGEYSDHQKTQLYDSSGGLITSTVTVGGETHYRVSPGQVVRAEFTYENNGASTQDGIAVGYYVSSNSTISTWDTKIASSTFTLSRDDVYTTRTTLSLPTSLTPGREYWLGAIIDDSGSLGEVAEWNNATYIPLRVVAGVPDLHLASLTHTPASPTTRDTITFRAVVKNIGTGPAGASTLELRVGGETPGSSAARFAVPSLSPGQSYPVERRLVLRVAQNYRNTATADVDDVVAESNEKNNVATEDYTVR
jgi:hypothetical protein